MDLERPITKEHIVKAVSDLPEDATVEDAMERLYLLSKIEQGLADSHAGKTVPHDEVVRRMEKKFESWRE